MGTLAVYNVTAPDLNAANRVQRIMLEFQRAGKLIHVGWSSYTDKPTLEAILTDPIRDDLDEADKAILFEAGADSAGLVAAI